MAERLDIAPMTAADLDAVADIERQSHRAPWPVQLFEEELDREWAHTDVVRSSGQVLAYCNYWLVQDEIHLLNITTHPDARRRGLARTLMERMLAFARARDCRLVTLEVRRSNKPAQALYKRYGFVAVGVRAGYYQEDGEDAIVMTLTLASVASIGGGAQDASTPVDHE
jgi:ribosomal-protein-alanine N-acetyltransferase